MHTEKSLPQANEMRQLIKNIFDLSAKLAYRIPITDLEDSADFAARIYGFKSWKEYKLYLNKDNAKISFVIPEKNSVMPNFNNVVTKKLMEYKVEQHEVWNKIPLSLKKIKNNILPEWLIGKYYIQKLKSAMPRGLQPLNTLITGSPASTIGTICNNHVRWLLGRNQSLIVFGAEENSKNFLQLKDDISKNIHLVGKNYKKLNPIGELLQSNQLEDFFHFDQDNQFFILWLQLVRKLTIQNNKKLNIEDLLNITHYTTLIEMYKLWENTDPFLYTLLNEYLFNICLIEETEDGIYNIPASGLENHYKLSYLLIEQLKQISLLYQEGYFSEDNDSLSITQLLFNKDNIYIIKEKNPYYIKIVTQLYNLAYHEHSKAIENLETKLYSYQCIWWEAQTWLTEYNVELINQFKEDMINHYYINTDFTEINKILTNVEQILFLTQNVSGYSQEWKNKMLCQTSKIDVNIWYDNSKCLQQLEKNEAILWSIVNTASNPKGIDEFHLEKIEVYDETIYSNVN